MGILECLGIYIFRKNKYIDCLGISLYMRLYEEKII